MDYGRGHSNVPEVERGEEKRGERRGVFWHFEEVHQALFAWIFLEYHWYIILIIKSTTIFPGAFS